jgi:uncharacterized membrane protein YidH (DUF202 family)
MKFGKELLNSAHPTFKNYYIAYKDLKLAIKIITGEEGILGQDDEIVASTSKLIDMLSNQTSISSSPSNQFQILLDHELKKINNFSNIQFSVLQEEIRELIYRLTHDIAVDEEPINTLSDEIVAFEEYIRLNFTGFRKAVKKFDKWNKSDSSNWFLSKIIKADFMSIHIDSLLLGLSIVHSIRSKQYDGRNASIFSDFGSKRRNQFFISPSDTVRIESSLSKHMTLMCPYPLPIEVPALMQGLIDAYTHPGGRIAGGYCPEYSMNESVIVFEDSKFGQYVTRRSKSVANNPEFSGYDQPVYSIRWNQFLAKEGLCWVVRESHPKYIPVKERKEFYQVKQKNLSDLINRKTTIARFVSAEGLESSNPFFNAFFEFLVQYLPSAMYNYRRTVFTTADLIVAIDKDIKFYDLKNYNGSFFNLPVSQFQSILSQRTMTIIQDADELPKFLTDILGDPSVSEVTGFSKAIHAEAALHVVTELERPVTVGLPQWFLHTISGDDSKMAANMASINLEDDSSGKFDVLPDVSSKLLIHDIVASKEPKQQSIPQTPVTISIPKPIPTAAPLIGTNTLEVPLLTSERHPSSRKSESLFDQIKYILFGSVIPEVPEPAISKIEPKTFLANERTFLNWCYVSFIISAVAIALVSIDPTAHLESSCLSLVALVTLIWSLNVYRLRVIALRNMKALETLLVSSNGAVFVCLSVAFALAVTWLGRYRMYMSQLVV